MGQLLISLHCYVPPDFSIIGVMILYTVLIKSHVPLNPKPDTQPLNCLSHAWRLNYLFRCAISTASSFIQRHKGG